MEVPKITISGGVLIKNKISIICQVFIAKYTKYTKTLKEWKLLVGKHCEFSSEWCTNPSVQSSTLWILFRAVYGSWNRGWDLNLNLRLSGYTINIFTEYVKVEKYLPRGCWVWNFCNFLGGLSLHLNHLIAECISAPYWQFGTLPIGIFLSNLVSRQLETSLMTSYCHFWNLSTFGNSRAIWVFWPKLGVFRKSKFSRWRSDGASMRLGGVLGSQITRLYDGTIFWGVRCT